MGFEITPEEIEGIKQNAQRDAENAVDALSRELQRSMVVEAHATTEEEMQTLAEERAAKYVDWLEERAQEQAEETDDPQEQSLTAEQRDDIERTYAEAYGRAYLQAEAEDEELQRIYAEPEDDGDEEEEETIYAWSPDLLQQYLPDDVADMELDEDDCALFEKVCASYFDGTPVKVIVTDTPEQYNTPSSLDETRDTYDSYIQDAVKDWAEQVTGPAGAEKRSVRRRRGKPRRRRPRR